MDSQRIKTILFSQEKPRSLKSPFLAFEQKHNLKIDFFPFINIRGVDAKVFKQKKIDVADYGVIIFSSKNAIEHFFRIIKECSMRLNSGVKYLCTSKFVYSCFKKHLLFRKRRANFVDINIREEVDIFLRNNYDSKFLFVDSVIDKDEILDSLKRNNCDFIISNFYDVVSNNIGSVLKNNSYDIICIFTPGGVKSIFDNLPDYKKGNTLICVYGNNTKKIADKFGLAVDFKFDVDEHGSFMNPLNDIVISLNNNKII